MLLKKTNLKYVNIYHPAWDTIQNLRRFLRKELELIEKSVQ